MENTVSRGVTVPMNKYEAAYAWCVRTYHPATIEKRKWYVDIQPLLDPEFVFEQDHDAALFILKWL